MPRYALRVEYDGRPFAGWQRQDGPPTVQARLEKAISQIESGVPSIAAAGRTDAGVHATGQVAHADLEQEWDPFRLSEALNYHLKPEPVAITAAALVADDWHARFSAVGRVYEYRIIQRRAPLVLDAGHAWHVKKTLDVDAMRAGAAHLIGTHDFTTFRSTMCQAKSPVKSLDRIEFGARPVASGTEITITVAARSFLHNQVRSIVGTLERVGAGAWQPDDVGRALAAADRAACGPVAPPDGLVLAEVLYQPAIF